MNESIQDFDIVYDTRVEYIVITKIYSKLHTLLYKYSDIEMKFLYTFENVKNIHDILKDKNVLKCYYHKIQEHYQVFQNYTNYIVKTFNKNIRLDHIIKDIPLGYSFKEIYDKFHIYSLEINNYIEEEKSLYKLMSGVDYESIQELIEEPNEKNDTTTLYKQLKYEIKTLCRISALNYTLYSNYQKNIQLIFV